MTAVDEMIKKQGTKHHSNMEKMEQHFTRVEANRRAPATVKRDHRGRCRPRGRKATSDASWQSQATRVVRLGSQQTGGAKTGFVEAGMR